VLRLAYSQTLSPTQDRQPGEPAMGVLDERFGAVARARLLRGRLHAWAGLAYSLLNAQVAEAQAGARAQLSGREGLQAEYVFAAPTFDGDSIWNVFGGQGWNDARLTYDLTVGRMTGYARAFVRLFKDQTLPSGAAPPAVADPGAYGGSLGARVGVPRGSLRLDGYGEAGYGGVKLGADLAGRVRVIESSLLLEARLSLVHFAADLSPANHADSFGVAGGAIYRLLAGLDLHLLVEENVSRLYASQLRALLLLDVSYWLGASGQAAPRSRTGWF
jgi:hypothetical protein